MEFAVLLPWITIVVSTFATALAGYHFKGKSELYEQVSDNKSEIIKLKEQRKSDFAVLTTNIENLEKELQETRQEMKSDVEQINRNVIDLIGGVGELRGAILSQTKRN